MCIYEYMGQVITKNYGRYRKLSLIKIKWFRIAQHVAYYV